MRVSDEALTGVTQMMLSLGDSEETFP